jgi:hypothetical protein
MVNAENCASKVTSIAESCLPKYSFSKFLAVGAGKN